MITLLSHFAAADSCSSFLGFPTWYEYIKAPGGACSAQLSNLSDIWLIVAAIIEIMLRIAALVAVSFVIVGGIQYLTSQGEPEKTNHARQTILNAVIGLAIAVLAAVVINFIAVKINAPPGASS